MFTTGGPREDQPRKFILSSQSREAPMGMTPDFSFPLGGKP